MNIKDIKELMAQFDESTLREFSYKVNGVELLFSKNEVNRELLAPVALAERGDSVSKPQEMEVTSAAGLSSKSDASQSDLAEGDVVESPLVGVAYLSPAPDKPAFVAVGDSVKKGQTLMIIEAMKVMNEVPAPCDGVVTEILVANEAVIEFGQGLVRIK